MQMDKLNEILEQVNELKSSLRYVEERVATLESQFQHPEATSEDVVQEEELTDDEIQAIVDQIRAEQEAHRELQDEEDVDNVHVVVYIGDEKVAQL